MSVPQSLVDFNVVAITDSRPNVTTEGLSGHSGGKSPPAVQETQL